MQIIYDMPHESYHALSAISNSGLKILGTKSPAHFKYWRDNPKPSTDAQLFGIAYHMAILEPQRFAESVIYIPGNGNKKEVKEAVKEAQENGLIVLRGNDGNNQMETIRRMRDVLYQNPRAAKLLTGGKEITALWTDHETGVECKGRMDAAYDTSILIDLKTTQDASFRGFVRSIVTYDYFVQAAYYMDGYEIASGIRPEGFVFIAQEKEPPYAVALYEPDLDALINGRRVYRRRLDRYAECLKTDIWPAYPQGITEIYIPEWTGEKE